MMVGMKIRMTMKGLFAYRHGEKMVVSFDMLSVFFPQFKTAAASEFWCTLQLDFLVIRITN